MREGYRLSGATDSSASLVPGVVYYYWVQIKPRFNNPGDQWTDILGDDSGWAGPVPDIGYTILTSDQPGGPLFHWIDVSRAGERLQGLELVTPSEVTLNASSQFYSAQHLIDDSGLSATPTLQNLASITHAAATSSNAWVTDGVTADYFAGGGTPPVLTMELPFTGWDFIEWKVSELVLWGYHFGSANGNEAKRFRIESMVNQGFPISTLVPTGEEVTVSSPALLASGNVRIPLPGGPYLCASDRALDLGGLGLQHMLVDDASFLNTAAAGDAITVSFWQKLSAVASTSSF